MKDPSKKIADAQTISFKVVQLFRKRVQPAIERWWGGYYLLNREEIEWIVRDLFVGNELWKGWVRDSRGRADSVRTRLTSTAVMAPAAHAKRRAATVQNV